MSTPATVVSPLAVPEILRRPEAGPPPRLVEYHFDPGAGALWSYLKPDAPAWFTPALLAELAQTRRLIAGREQVEIRHFDPGKLRFHVMASRIPEIFSLGGDLGHFLELIRSGRRAALEGYARAALDLVYSMATGHGRDVITLALVRGRAMGGGFEAALAADVLVAEQPATFGFPETLFNMFPGMGAYALLRRRLAHAEAERLVLSGRTYTAADLHELGVVDVLTEAGEGERAVHDYIKRSHARQRGQVAWRRALRAAHPIDLRRMLRILDAWLDAAFALESRDMEVMALLQESQMRYAPEARASA